MPLDMFEFTVLRWKLPLMHARELDDVAYEKAIDEDDDYDEFIAACQVVYRGAARTAEVTRYLVLLVMFSRTALEPVDGRKAKMEALFRWATGEAPTNKGKAGRLGAALRVSHFLFRHGEFMDAFVLHRYFSLNSVIDCPKTLLVDDRLLSRLLEQLSTARHSTAQVMELAHRILQGEDEMEEEGKHKHARTPRVAADAQPARPRLQSIKAVKEDGTYLVELSNRSRCVSLTKKAIISTNEGAAMLIAFSSTHGAEAEVQTRPSRKEHAVVEVCGRRAKQHQALLEGNTCRRWYPTTQLLLWKDGKAKVEEYEVLHPPTGEPPAFFGGKEQAYYIDQVSKEPLTDPYTLEAGGHRESYNLSSWQSLLGVRHTCSPVLKAPIEFYQPDGLAVFVPQPDPPLKAKGRGAERQYQLAILLRKLLLYVCCEQSRLSSMPVIASQLPVFGLIYDYQREADQLRKLQQLDRVVLEDRAADRMTAEEMTLVLDKCLGRLSTLMKSYSYGSGYPYAFIYALITALLITSVAQRQQVLRDLTKDTLQVPRSPGNSEDVYVIKHSAVLSKSRTPGLIPLPTELTEPLSFYLAKVLRPGHTGPIFVQKNRKPITDFSIATRSVCKEFIGRPINAHSLRHTMATAFHDREDVSDSTMRNLAEVMNHTPEVQKSHYIFQQRKKSVRKLQDIIMEGVRGKRQRVERQDERSIGMSDALEGDSQSL
jgi:integrase